MNLPDILACALPKLMNNRETDYHDCIENA
jgi:hypothetical protein